MSEAVDEAVALEIDGRPVAGAPGHRYGGPCRQKMLHIGPVRSLNPSRAFTVMRAAASVDSVTGFN